MELENGGTQALGLSHMSNQVLTDYPSYPPDHSAVHWAESRISRAHRFRQHRRDLILGSRVPHDTPLSMCWRNILRTDELQWLNERANGDESLLSPSFLLQMAIRAGRQLASNRSWDKPVIQLDGVTFRELLNPAAFLSSQELETQFQLTAQISDDHYTFRLLIHDAASGDDWSNVFEGRISVLSELALPFNPRVTTTVKRDEGMVACMQSDLPPCPNAISLSAADKVSISGEVNEHLSFTSTETSNLELFDWIVSLLHRQMSVLAGPSKYTLATVEKLTVDLEAVEASSPHFKMTIQDCAAGRGQGKLNLTSSGITSLAIEGATSIVVEQEQARPPISSLFFKPAWLQNWLQDIAAMQSSDTDSLKLAHLIELVTHKWSACDIGIATNSEKTQSLLLGLLQGARSPERPRFRSLTTMLTPKAPTSKRVIHDVEFPPKDLRLLFAEEADLDEWKRQVIPGGYICILHSHAEPNIEANSELEKLCAVEIDSSTSGMLLRRRMSDSITKESHRTLMVSTTSTEAVLEDVQSLYVGSEGHKPGTPVDLIVFDNSDESLLCLTPPETWLSSVQKLVADARKLLWVTKNSDGFPHWGAASAFLRTLSSEQPLLSVASLTLIGDVTLHTLDSVVKTVLETMRAGSKESELRFEDGQLKILRYLPDDELNALTGTGPVHRTLSPITSVNHRIDHTQPGQMALTPIRHLNVSPPATGDFVDLDVKLSVVDVVDVEDAFSNKIAAYDPGQFFLGSKVGGVTLYFGYRPQCHVKKLRVPIEQTLEVPRSVDPKQALLSPTAHAIAHAIMTQILRVRSNDTIRFSFSNNNKRAVEDVARFLGCHGIDDERQPVEFDLGFVPKTGFTLNGKVVDVKSALRKTRFNSTLGRAWISIADHKVAPPEYYLDSVQSALTHAAQTGDAVILNHVHEIEALQEFRHIGVLDIFRQHVFYVLIGGFGGLGLLLMEWMLQKGARNFAVISRSGASSKGAQTATQRIDS
jgi:hypothetical protein